MLTTYHTHSQFCDGKMTPEDYVLSAIRKGFTAIGLSSHAPVTFETHWTMKPEKLSSYIDNVLHLKEKYRNRIQIYLGLETDYYPGGPDYRDTSGLDYTIGSVHFIQQLGTERVMALDGTPEEFIETRDILFNGDTRALVEQYYHLLMELIQKRPPDILGHLDVLKKNNAMNRFFDESQSWYQDIVVQTLDLIRQKQIIVEINTGGIARGYTTEVYPSDWIIAMMKQRDIPIMLNSDAHHPDAIDAFYAEATDKLKAAGYTQQRVLLDGIWQDINL